MRPGKRFVLHFHKTPLRLIVLLIHGVASTVLLANETWTIITAPFDAPMYVYVGG